MSDHHGPLYPDITVPLTDEDGNSFSIVARASKLARRARVPQEEIDKFQEEAVSGDYDNVLQTVMRWFDWE